MVLFFDKQSLLRVLFAPLAVVLTSFYLFPFEFSFARGFNTKMIMAGCGCFLLCIQLAQKGFFEAKRDLSSLFYVGGMVSLCGLLSVLYNRTNDYTYTTYIVSMAVWLSAANVVVSFIRSIHGYVSVLLVCKYLIVVCFLQCFSALVIDNSDAFKNLVNTYVANFSSSVSTGNSLDGAGRLYGIGAALDIAGSRFSTVLIMVAFCAMNSHLRTCQLWTFLVMFIFIFIVGCSISRTTTVGFILSVIIWIISYTSRMRNGWNMEMPNRQMLKVLIVLLLLTIPFVTYLYHVNEGFHNSFRFAFEGFFNWLETGVWRTNSTDTLRTMYVFPEEIKTWFIGDGYFADPHKTDPYYIGVSLSGFYKGVDVGYLRFVYYFGLMGLLVFCLYFMIVAKSCISRFPKYKLMFVAILAVNFIVWFKVATDIFLVFALFLCIGKEENEKYEECCLINYQAS